jgi:hypothetical protein
MSDFNSTFILAVCGIGTAFLSGLVVYCIKSKCSKFEICYGMLRVERNVQIELDEEKLEIENGLKPFSNGQEK